jgi:lipoyl(octanoyl) transferase
LGTAINFTSSLAAPGTEATAAFCDLGLMAYGRAHSLQVELAAGRHQGKLTSDLFLAVEHPPVFTLGRRGGREHLGVSEAFLASRGIALVPIERGGEITYHGPGQLVLYPIFSLRQARLSVSDYVFKLEEVMRLVAADFGVMAGRDARNHGVWVGNNKLGSIGIAIRHGVAFHGLALNVNNDLEPFGWINPCGLTDIGITSLARERGAACPMETVRVRLQQHLAEVFHVQLHQLSVTTLLADSSFLDLRL